jgi:hypothetical protein
MESNPFLPTQQFYFSKLQKRHTRKDVMKLFQKGIIAYYTRERILLEGYLSLIWLCENIE